MDKHEMSVLRGEEASRVLSSQVFTEAFEMVRQAYIRTWEELPTTKYEQERDDIHRRIKCLADVRKQLESVIQTGKLAQHEITLAEKALKFTKRMSNAFATSR